jgi:uncharacterized protein with von Willebrand factor type A (vWA) domain
MYSELEEYIRDRELEFDDIPESRKKQLEEVAEYIKRTKEVRQRCKNQFYLYT